MRFNFSIVGDDGEIIAQDWTTFGLHEIDEYGAVPTIDIHTGTALRAVKRDSLRNKLRLVSDEDAGEVQFK